MQSGAVDGELYIIISDEEHFRGLDRGGIVYSLPGDTFDNDPKKGLRELEWTSDKSVVPLDKEIVPSALNDMLEYDVRVYFVSKEIYQDTLKAPDHGKSIVKALTPYKR